MSLRNNTIANYFGQGWTALMGLAFVPFYIRYLGVEAWGLVGVLSMMQAWLTLLDIGLSPTLSREMARFQAGEHTAQSIRDLLRSLEWIYVGIAVVIVSGVLFTAPWLAVRWLSAQQLSVAEVNQAINMMGVVLAARMVEQIYRGAIQGLQRQVWLNVAQSLLATLRWGGALIVLMCFEISIEAFFLWQGVVSLLTVMIFARQTYLYLPGGFRRAHFDLDGIIRIRHFAGGMMLTTLSSLLLTQVDKILLSRLVSLENFGIYTIAGSVAGALYFLVLPISTAITPRLTELVAKSEQHAIINTYHQASQWMAVVVIPFALVMAAFAQPLLLLWTDNLDLSTRAAPVLTFLALGTLCNGFMHVPYAAQLAYGWPGFAVRVNVVAIVIIVPSIIWSVPKFGAIGAAWAWLALNAGYVLIGTHFMYRRILPTEKWRWFRYAVIGPLAIGSFTVMVLRYMAVLPQSRLSMAFALIGIAMLIVIMISLTTPTSRKYLLRRFKTLQETPG